MLYFCHCRQKVWVIFICKWSRHIAIRPRARCWKNIIAILILLLFYLIRVWHKYWHHLWYRLIDSLVLLLLGFFHILLYLNKSIYWNSLVIDVFKYDIVKLNNRFQCFHCNLPVFSIFYFKGTKTS